MDTKNTPLQHLMVGAFALALVAIFNRYLGTEWSTSFGRVSFILLFMVLFIGPATKIKRPKDASSPLTTPWSWRSELGIWFTLTALTHFIIILTERPLSALIKIGGSGFSLTNLLGLIALFWGLVLAATSFEKVIHFLGVLSWKWLHSLTYVVFYLSATHLAYFQFFSAYGEIGPDWFGYTATTMAAIIILMQVIAFIKTVAKHNQELALISKKKPKK